MNKIFTFLLLAFALHAHGQGEKPLQLVGGLRLNPSVSYNEEGRSAGFAMHAEIGVSYNSKWYYALGYTPINNSVYSFNQYWITDFKKKIPFAPTLIAVYNVPDKQSSAALGFNVAFNGGKHFGGLFISSPFNKWDLSLILSAVVPLNLTFYKRE